MAIRSPVRNSRQRQCQFGFTLIELVVSISIIVLLVAILLPALQAARYQGKVVQCTSNLRQIGIAQFTYLSDYRFHFFEYVGNSAYREFGQGGKSKGGVSDPRPLTAYVNEVVSVFRCPLDGGRAASPYAALQPNIWSHTGSSYIFNTVGIPARWTTSNVNPHVNIDNQSEAITDVSRFVLFGEYCLFDLNWDALPSRLANGWPVLNGSGNFHDPFFSDPSSNLLFADGHVKQTQPIRGVGRFGEPFILVTRP